MNTIKIINRSLIKQIKYTSTFSNSFKHLSEGSSNLESISETNRKLKQRNEENQIIKTESPIYRLNKVLNTELEQELRNDYRVKQMDKYYNDSLMMSLDECDHLPTLLNLIRPYFNKMRPDHLEMIYYKMNLLLLKLNRTEIEELNEHVRNSENYNLLLGCTLRQIRMLDERCLVNALKTFSLVNQDPNSKIVIVVLEMIKHKINHLGLESILDCFFALELYSKNYADQTNLTSVLNVALLQVANYKILSNKYDYENVDLVLKFVELNLEANFRIKLRVVAHLLEPLIEIDLNFEQSVKLLKLLKEIKRERRLKKQMMYSNLIEKCNMIVYSELELNRSNEK